MSLAPRPRPTHSTTHVSTIESQEEGKQAARGGRATGFDDDPLKRCSDGAQVELGDAVFLGFGMGLVLCLVKGGGGGAGDENAGSSSSTIYITPPNTHTRTRLQRSFAYRMPKASCSSTSCSIVPWIASSQCKSLPRCVLCWVGLVVGVVVCVWGGV